MTSDRPTDMTPDHSELVGSVLAGFAFYYPLFMSYLWMAGALFYWFRFERRQGSRVDAPPPRATHPLVAVLVPCHNEEDNLLDTMTFLSKLDYPNYEIIAINDGSTDGTAALLDRMASRYPRLRVVHLARNQGKAMALNTAAKLTRAEFLVCIDGDALLDPHAIHWLLQHFEWPRVGAVTGNPRVRTRSTLLGRLQVGEFSSTIGMIKRAQRTYGRVFTVSGVISAFRRTAVHDVGYWSNDILTEDVDMSWKLQARHWDIRFEPKALCWILMPETFKGLWRQRLRWAEGGTQVLLKQAGLMGAWRHRRMWPVYIEYMTSVVWAYTMATLMLFWLLGTVLGLPVPFTVRTILPEWTGVIVGTTCLLQIGIGMLLDRGYDRRLARHFFWMIWYPLGFWMLTVFTTIVAFPKALLRNRGKRATWTSPDRGIKPASR